MKINKFLSNNIFVFIFFLILVFLLYMSTFGSYFESDEWFYLTYYLPLTKSTFGIFTAVFSMFSKSGYLSGGQHVVPIAALIYFLNVKFFGLNFGLYAFMSLFIHAVNSFLVFRVIKILLINTKRNRNEMNFWAILGSLFFALSPVPMHAFTGFAFFYGQNVISVTFSLMCIICYELSFLKQATKYVIYSSVFLLLSIFTQESSTYLFFVLPIVTIFRKNIHPFKYLGKVYICILLIYLLIRFGIPNIQFLSQQIVDRYLSITINDVKTSANPILPSELIFRSLTFPVRMIGSIYIPREVNASILKFIAPIVSPYPKGGDPTTQLAFLNYSGQTIIIYFFGFFIIWCGLKSVVKFIRKKRYQEANYIIYGLSITLFSALPLVALIFVFPLWGYDIYFDSRYYYNPEIGASLLFPFLVFSVARYISKKLHFKKLSFVVFLILFLWLVVNVNVFINSIKMYTMNYTTERKYVVKQLTSYLPLLKTKTVFYIETDGKSPFVSLPFFTSVPQALSVIYFYRNSLPNSFYNRSLFLGKPQGYQYENGKGFGYYTSKEMLFEAIQAKMFDSNDVYGFYYYGKNSKIINITTEIRKEINGYLNKTQ